MWKRVDVSKQQRTSIKKGLQTRSRKASLLRSFAWVYLWQAEIRGTASAPPTQKTEEEIVPFLSFVHNKQQWLTVLDFSLSLHFLHISLALSYLIPRQTMPPPPKKKAATGFSGKRSPTVADRRRRHYHEKRICLIHQAHSPAMPWVISEKVL